MITERDTLNPDLTFNWSAIREIAMLRALAEHDLDIITQVYTTPIRLPADISQHNIRDWRHRLAEQALRDNPLLETMPFIDLYRAEMRRVCSAARAIRSVQRAEQSRHANAPLMQLLVASVRRTYQVEHA